KKTLPKVREALLGWYRQNHRKLPWRENTDPYRIWISEIMLQQTRVAAVIEYYWRFLERFPDVKALASASEEEVVSAWSGLGYYRRARAMHAAAKKVTQEYGGEFPRTIGELRALPGIGRYTAAAIASIAFGSPTAVVDGNVERVLSRWLGRDLRDREETWAYAEQLLEAKHAGEWNQAVMELGALVCVPAEPKCLNCPVSQYCGDPGRKTKKPQGMRRKKELVMGLASRGGSVYLVQRPVEERIMAGMWELPTCDAVNGSEVLHKVRHSITNSDYQVSVVAANPGTVRGGKWITKSKLQKLPLTGLTKKILRAANLWPQA
ncbi:MAG TPA: A/G-specific adenine glycosylase, partial [Terriglobales bacterium]